MKEEDKTSEKELNEVQISSQPNKKFKIMIIKMLNERKRRMNEHSENFNRVRKYKEPEMNTINEIKNTLEKKSTD